MSPLSNLTLAEALSHGGFAEPHSAYLMGFVYGLVHVAGPDHLGTLMTLSSLMDRVKAFRVGAAWGFGHSFGMVFIALFFMCLQHLFKLDAAMWEHVGNYVIGGSMVACGLYFVIWESSFLTEKADGTFVAQPCACCDEGSPVRSPDPEWSPRGQSSPSRSPQFCANYRSCPEARSEAPEERQVDDTWQAWLQKAWAERNIKGVLLGAFQGACCPLGLLGVGFLTNLPTSGTVAFLVVFLPVSILGTGLLAMCWALLTSYGAALYVSPVTVYRTSCGFTMSLGMAWIVCNYLEILGQLNYSEAIAH